MALRKLTIDSKSQLDAMVKDNVVVMGTETAPEVVLAGAPPDSYTKLLLHMNGIDGSQTFTDETGKTVTAYGNAQIDTAQSKFGGASGLFDGDGDYLSVPDHADWDFGTNNFTLDFWVRPGVTDPAVNRITGAGTGTPGVNALWTLGFGTTWGGGNKIHFGVFTAAGAWVNYFSNAVTLTAGNQYHIEFARSGDTYYFFLGGNQVGTGPMTGSIDAGGTQGLVIGARPNNFGGISECLNGHIDEFRISKGIARWTANFTPPTKEYREYAFTGTLISNPEKIDAIILGMLRWVEELLEGTDITFATRTGPTETPDANWSAWSGELTNPVGSQMASPADVYIQFRVTFTTTDTAKTPRLYRG